MANNQNLTQPLPKRKSERLKEEAEKIKNDFIWDTAKQISNAAETEYKKGNTDGNIKIIIYQNGNNYMFYERICEMFGDFNNFKEKFDQLIGNAEKINVVNIDPTHNYCYILLGDCDGIIDFVDYRKTCHGDFI